MTGDNDPILRMLRNGWFNGVENSLTVLQPHIVEASMSKTSEAAEADHRFLKKGQVIQPVPRAVCATVGQYCEVIRTVESDVAGAINLETFTVNLYEKYKIKKII